MELFPFGLFAPFGRSLEPDASGAVEEGKLPHADPQGLAVVLDPALEHGVIGQEPHLRAGAFGLVHGKRFHHEIGDRFPSFVPLLVHHAVPADHDFERFGECIHHRQAHAMKATRDLVPAVVSTELSTRVQHGEHGLERRFLRGGVLCGGNASSIVGHAHPTAFLQLHLHVRGVSGLHLVHRIVHELVHEVVQAFGSRAADVHAWTLAHWIQTFQNLDLFGVVARRRRGRGRWSGKRGHQALSGTQDASMLRFSIRTCDRDRSEPREST
eukprot:scaffold177_cov334-Pavlova_lutheri.AAC.89